MARAKVATAAVVVIITASTATMTGVITEAKAAVALIIAVSSPATAEMLRREWTLITYKAAPRVSPVSPQSMAHWFNIWIWQTML